MKQAILLTYSPKIGIKRGDIKKLVYIQMLTSMPFFYIINFIMRSNTDLFLYPNKAKKNLMFEFQNEAIENQHLRSKISKVVVSP